MKRWQDVVLKKSSLAKGSEGAYAEGEDVRDDVEDEDGGDYAEDDEGEEGEPGEEEDSEGDEYEKSAPAGYRPVTVYMKKGCGDYASPPKFWMPDFGVMTSDEFAHAIGNAFDSTSRKWGNEAPAVNNKASMPKKSRQLNLWADDVLSKASAFTERVVHKAISDEVISAVAEYRKSAVDQTTVDSATIARKAADRAMAGMANGANTNELKQYLAAYGVNGLYERASMICREYVGDVARQPADYESTGGVQTLPAYGNGIDVA